MEDLSAQNLRAVRYWNYAQLIWLKCNPIRKIYLPNI